MTDVYRDENNLKTNLLLDEVERMGQERAVQWYRAAYHSHNTTKRLTDARYLELVNLLLANVTRPLTVREAQLCGVCRVCRTKVTAPFVLNYGAEFAHESCLKGQSCPSR